MSTLIQAGIPNADHRIYAPSYVRSFQFGQLDPTPTHWTASAPRSETVAPLSEPDKLALHLEVEAIAHRVELDAIRRRRLDALEQQVIRSCGGVVAYHTAGQRAARSPVPLPDPARSPAVARLQGRTLRVSGKTSREDAAEIRRQQLRRKPAAGSLARAGSGARQSYHHRVTERGRAANPLTASTGDWLRDEYRSVSGAILQLRASGHPVPARLAAHRDRLLREQRSRLTATRARRR